MQPATGIRHRRAPPFNPTHTHRDKLGHTEPGHFTKFEIGCNRAVMSPFNMPV
jgi:hypothetical protein